MGRTITAGMQTAIAGESSAIAHFIELQFSGGTIRLVTAPHDISWNSLTWVGIGGALSFDSVSESGDINAAGLIMSLSGVDQTILAALLGQFYIGRTVQVWLCHFDTAGAIVADPLLLFNGKMNGGFEIEESRNQDKPGTVSISARMSDRLADLDFRKGVQMNPDSYKKVFSDDLFFDFISDLVGKKLNWGLPRL